MLSSLPISLLVLLFALPVLATNTSANDAFRAISLHTPKAKQDPVCCLKPLPSLKPQPSEDELLLSFEDWKAKLLAEQRNTASNDNESVGWSSGKDPVVGGAGNSGNGSAHSSVVLGTALATPSPGASPFPQDQSDANEQLSPHFRVLLTDRFDYANLDCSARVHTSHRSAKSTSSILSSKKDRYMLSPCSTKSSDGKEENHFVVVELCDDIRIDTVQLANFEFFSGVFKDLTVSVAKTYTTEPEGWVNAGTYRAKNVRGVQSFHPPTSLRDFYRYIRIDFHSHYGNEYYCPVSLLRVFGLTHLEEWKWDIWEAESRAKRSGVISASSADPSPNTAERSREASGSSLYTNEVVEPTDDDSRTLSSIPASATDFSYSGDSQHRQSTDMWTPNETSDHSFASYASSMADVYQSGTSSHAYSSSTEGTVLTNSDDQDTTTAAPGRRSPLTHPISKITSSATSLSDAASTVTTESYSSSGSVDQPIQLSADHTSLVTSDTSSISTLRSSATSSSSSGTTPTISLSSQPLISPLHVPSTGGESIYRTIMNRLNVLELNTTLYTRYVEEQTAGVREVLRRLGEDVGRLEGISKAQAQMYQRSIVEMQKHRKRLELEHGELMSRVNFLAEEVVMEKRLGIAQLCILVAVLIFMTLTRGSRGEPVDHRSAVLQQFSRGSSWGQRQLSFSGDWVSRFRSRSPTPKYTGGGSQRNMSDKVEFPTQRVSEPRTTDPRASHTSSYIPSSASFRRATAHPRTPQSRTPGRHTSKQSTPTGSNALVPPLLIRPMRSRTSSHGHTISSGSTPLIGAVPRSAKRWARSAHLHEVKGDSGTRGPTGKQNQSDEGTLARTATGETSSGVKITMSEGRRRSGSRRSSPFRTLSASSSTPVLAALTREGSGNSSNVESEVDAWVDTDDTSSDADFVQDTRRGYGRRPTMREGRPLGVGSSASLPSLAVGA